MCEDCRADVGDEIYDGIQRFTTEWPDAEFGPAHIVLSDFNVGKGHVRWCLALIALEQERRGLRADNPYADALGADDVAHFGHGFYSDCDGTELAETETFLRDWLMPKVGEDA
jgi:hypothetical protein